MFCLVWVDITQNHITLDNITLFCHLILSLNYVFGWFTPLGDIQVLIISIFTFSLYMYALMHVFSHAYMHIPGISILKFLQILIRWVLRHRTVYFALLLEQICDMSNCFSTWVLLSPVVSYFLVSVFRHNRWVISFFSSNPFFWCFLY